MSDERIVSQLSEKSIDFREVVDSLTDGVMITDGKGITQYVNPAFSRSYGIKPEEVIGRSVFEIAEEGVLFKHSVSGDVIRTGRRSFGAGIVRTINGRTISGYATGVPICDGSGRIKLVVSSHIDAERMKARFEEFKDSLRAGEAVHIMDSPDGETGSTVIGEDPALKQIQRIIAMAAPTDVTILITGESGVGKELLADQVFRLSRRKGKPYVKVNCTAIPANLLESELFGYEKGAFTGALSSGKAGLFEIANGGTILLDEIGDLPIELQTKLLRVLQEKEVTRVGGTKPRALDVRVIAATNANLRQKIAEGKFREDLFYRLSVIPISVPPLRERPGDIISMVKYFFQEYCKRHGRNLTMSEKAYEMFEGYDWPGNVRELQNVIEYLVICSEGDEFDDSRLAELLGLDEDGPAEAESYQQAMDRFEKQLLENAIHKAGGIRKAAAQLGIDPSTVSRKAKKYGIILED